MGIFGWHIGIGLDGLRGHHRGGLVFGKRFVGCGIFL